MSSVRAKPFSRIKLTPNVLETIDPHADPVGYVLSRVTPERRAECEKAIARGVLQYESEYVETGYDATEKALNNIRTRLGLLHGQQIVPTPVEVRLEESLRLDNADTLRELLAGGVDINMPYAKICESEYRGFVNGYEVWFANPLDRVGEECLPVIIDHVISLRRDLLDGGKCLDRLVQVAFEHQRHFEVERIISSGGVMSPAAVATAARDPSPLGTRLTRMMLNQGAGMGESAIDATLPFGNEATRKLLLSRGAPVDYRSIVTLMDRDRDVNVDLVMELVQHVGKLEPFDSKGRLIPYTKLALDTGNLDLTEAVLKAGASVHGCEYYRQHPFKHAIDRRFDDTGETAQLLIEYGALEWRDPKDGGTWLHRAAQAGHVPAIRAIVQSGFDLEIEDKGQRTPLHLAAEAGKAAAVEALVDYGADLDRRCLWGGNALHFAALGGSADTIECLLELGMDINPREQRGCTPLFIAAKMGHLDVVKMLLKHGADHRVADDRGETPLHAAARKSDTGPFRTEESRNRRDVVLALIERGADRNAENNRGETAVDLAPGFPFNYRKSSRGR